MVGVTWVVGLLAARSLLQRCGVSDRAGQWALAYVVATGGLIAAVHLAGFAWLISGRPVVTPPIIAVIFPVVMGAILALLRRMVGEPTDARVALAACLPVATGGQAARGTQRSLTVAARIEKHRLGRPCRIVPRGWWLPVIVLAGTYGVFLIDAAARYPTGWDGVHYHLPMAVRWLQQRTIDVVPGTIVQNYPNNGIIPSYLLLSVGLQRLTSLAMVPQGILLALIVYAITGRLGIGRLGRLIGTCVVMSIPMVIYQTYSAYVDLFATTAWLASLLALMWASRVSHPSPKRCLILVAGLACGIAIGSKLTYVVVGGMLAAVAAALPWITRGRRDRLFMPALRSAALFVLAAGVCSGFWFVRNVVRTGNPIYPLGLTIAGVNLFDGLSAAEFFPERTLGDKLHRWWAYPWIEGRSTGHNYSVGYGLGAAFAAFVPLGLLGCLVSSRGRRARRTADRWRIVSLLLVCAGAVLFMTLLHQTLRFALPMIILSVLCAMVLIQRVARRRPRWVMGLLAASLTVTGAAAVLLPGKEFLGRVRDDVWTRHEFYEIPPMINRLPAGSTIVNVNAHIRNFALLGENLTNRVVGPGRWHIALAGHAPTRAFLDELGADYLFTTGDHAADWPADLDLKIVYDSRVTGDRVGGAPVSIYQVLRRQSEELAGQSYELPNERSQGL